MLIRSIMVWLQAIQHIERTQERRASAEEEQRRAVIVSPAHITTDTACSDTDTDTEGEDGTMNWFTLTHTKHMKFTVGVCHSAT